MPFDMYGDVVLTRDVPEHGVRAGDIGAVVERHVAPGVNEEGYSANARGGSTHARGGVESRKSLQTSHLTARCPTAAIVVSEVACGTRSLVRLRVLHSGL